MLPMKRLFTETCSLEALTHAVSDFISTHCVHIGQYLFSLKTARLFTGLWAFLFFPY